MRSRRASVTAIGFVAFACGVMTTACQKETNSSEPVTAASDYYSLPDDTDRKVDIPPGTGFDPRSYRTTTPCFDNIRTTTSGVPSDDKQSGSTERIKVRYVFTRNDDDVKKAMGLDINGAYHTLGSGGTLSFSYSKGENRTSRSLTMTILAIADYNRTRLNGKPEFIRERTSLPNDKFVLQCGTHFVSAVYRGTRVAIELSASGVDTELYEKVTTKGEYQFSGLVADGSLRAQFSQSFEEARKQQQATINIDGVGTGGLKELVSGLINKDHLGDIREPIKAIGDALTQFELLLDEKHANPTGFTVRPYSDLDSKRSFPGRLSAYQEVQLSDIARLYSEAVFYRQLISTLLSNPADPLAVELRGKQVDIPTLRKDLDEFYNRVSEAHRKCLNSAECQFDRVMPVQINEMKPLGFPSASYVFFADGVQLPDDQSVQMMSDSGLPLLKRIQQVRPNATRATEAVRLSSQDPRVSIRTATVTQTGQSTLPNSPVCSDTVGSAQPMVVVLRTDPPSIEASIGQIKACETRGFVADDVLVSLSEAAGVRDHDGAHELWIMVSDNRGRLFRVPVGRSLWRANNVPHFETTWRPVVEKCLNGLACNKVVPEWIGW